MFRQLHRWTSLPLILFLILVLGTGVLLQLEEIGKIGGSDGGGSRPAVATMPSDAAIAAQLRDALAKARAALMALSPQNRLYQPDEVTSAALWLCGEGAGGVNGQAITIAGGEV